MEVKQFTKRPVTISAIQWTGDNLRAVITFIEGMVVTNDLASAARWDDYRDLVDRNGLIIKTLEGQHIASVGDWIIKGVKGEHYPCKPDIFELTYTPAVGVEGLEVFAVPGRYLAVNRKNPGAQDVVLLTKAQAIIDQQAARIAELQKDADRYRWLEANSTYGIDYRQRPELTLPIYAPDHRDGLDAAIDAAMRSGESK